MPRGVTELKFGEFFVQPAGDRGLEFTDKLRGLDGQRVRLVGFMVRQEPALPGRFLLSPLPLELHQHDDHCFIDDLPPSTVQVFVPARRDVSVPYQRGLMWLIGTLSVGNRIEPDGRISFVRLTAELPKATAKKHVAEPGKGAEQLLRTAQRAAP